jgi:hypothetical protein
MPAIPAETLLQEAIQGLGSIAVDFRVIILTLVADIITNAAVAVALGGTSDHVHNHQSVQIAGKSCFQC